MQIDVTYSKERIPSDVLVVDYFEDSLTGLSDRFPEGDSYYEIVEPVFASGDFAGKWKQVSVLYNYGKTLENRVLLVGLGERKDISPFKIKVSFAHALKKLRPLKIDTVSTFIDSKCDPDQVRKMVTFLVEAAYMSQYRQPTYKKEPPEIAPPISKLHFILLEGVDENEVREGIIRGSIIGQSINKVRDLINKPGNEVTPSYLAEYSQNLSKKSNLSCKVFDFAQLEEMKMGGLVNVGRGSKEKSRLIEISYTPEVESYRTVALVGKGVTFDSGGISLKPSRGMYRMKDDMSGAALVLGIIEAVEALKMPVKLLGLIPASENMPDGEAIKPGDIITAFDGTTVEVLDTDCEGRMILMDALGYAATQKPDLIVDLATLTGACTVALGRYVMGGMSNYEPIMNIMRASGDYMYERVWQLPLMEEYKLTLQSKFADIKNYGGREAGAITAGAFLSHFVGEIPWIHLDIAGVVWFDTETSLMPEGASGIGVRLIIDFLGRLIAEDKPELWQDRASTIKGPSYTEDEVSRPRTT